MSAHSHDHTHDTSTANDPRYRQALWIALVVNAAMFVVEIIAGFQAGSASLLADAIDFAGDAANYGLAIWALTMVSVWRSRTALLKGACMLAFGLFVLGKALWLAYFAVVPSAEMMGVIGVLALVANVSVAMLLYRYREGDANMRSVWLCTRNDAIGNVAVIIAAVVVWLTGHGAADVLVALLMGGLAVHSGVKVIGLARQELASENR
jgi:Co/Zn/Cd efflux system component